MRVITTSAQESFNGDRLMFIPNLSLSISPFSLNPAVQYKHNCYDTFCPDAETLCREAGSYKRQNSAPAKEYVTDKDGGGDRIPGPQEHRHYKDRDRPKRFP